MIVHNLNFCRLELYENYVLAVMHEGIVVDKTNNEILVEIAENYYKDTPFVYITHRKNSYSVDPIIYIKTSQIKSLKGFAVVSDTPIQKISVKYEKHFFSKKFCHFYSLEEAIAWKQEVLKSYQKDKSI